MLYSSRHIYLLLAGLLNLILGTYFIPRPGGRPQDGPTIRFALVVVSPGLLLAGFSLKPRNGPNRTMVAAFGIFALALGTLHVLSAVNRRGKWRGTDQNNER